MFKRKRETPYISSAELYDSCDTLPLANFERCEVDGDFNALKINEKLPCDDTVLREKWQKIQSQYADQSPNDKFGEYVIMKHTHLDLSGRVASMKKVIGLLRDFYVPELVEHLKELGYNENTGYQFNTEPIDNYYRDLNRIETSLADDEIQINDLAEKIAQYESEQSGGGKLKRGYFDEQLGHISKFMGMPLQKHVVTVTQYNTYLRQMNDHYKHLKQQKEHGR